jgi:hypothetical protein
MTATATITFTIPAVPFVCEAEDVNLRVDQAEAWIEERHWASNHGPRPALPAAQEALDAYRAAQA